MYSDINRSYFKDVREYLFGKIMIYSNSYCIVLVFLLYCVTILVQTDIILRVDPLALLSATLRTYQKAACDTDQVAIACPRGTSISIEFAQYNNLGSRGDFNVDELCAGEHTAKQLKTARGKQIISGSSPGPPTAKYPTARTATIAITEIPDTVAGGEVADNTTHQHSENNNSSSFNANNGDASAENCMWPNALQYSLLQTVVEACQKKKHCKFQGTSHYYRLTADDANTTASTVSVDPCHKRRKIVEVAYKCRPYEFRSKVACHNDIAQLECNPYSRIAVYSANFGRTEYESIQCPQPQGVREETCQASYATETVMQICHGRRRCNLAANSNTFGSPCKPYSRMYLKVVYTCVPKQVLKDRYESEVEADETNDFEGDNEVYDDELNYEAIPKVYNNNTVVGGNTRINSGNLTTAVTLNTSHINTTLDIDIPDSINAVKTHSIDMSLEDDQERLYLHLLIVGLSGIVLCIIAVSVHVLLHKNQTISSEAQMSYINSTNAACANTTISNEFNDTMSAIDAEINIPKTISVPTNVKNENYDICGLSGGGSVAGGLYSTHNEASSKAKNPAAHALADNSSIALTEAVIGSSTIINNAELCSMGQSPDVIGIPAKAYLPVTGAGAGGGQVSFSAMLTPAIVIESKGDKVGGGTFNCGTVVPMTSLAEFTSTPPIHARYILDSHEFLERNMPTYSSSSSSPMPGGNQHQQQQQHSTASVLNVGGAGINTFAFPSLMQQHQLAKQHQFAHQQQQQQQQQPAYDGTERRTLSTGIPVNSQFYYG